MTMYRVAVTCWKSSLRPAWSVAGRVEDTSWARGIESGKLRAVREAIWLKDRNRKAKNSISRTCCCYFGSRRANCRVGVAGAGTMNTTVHHEAFVAHTKVTLASDRQFGLV